MVTRTRRAIDPWQAFCLAMDSRCATVTPGCPCRGCQDAAHRSEVMDTITGIYDDATWYGEVTMNGRVLDPKPSLKVFNHSPDGFAWGYNGSGPAQLALAILLQAGLPKAQAIAWHQAFKRAFLQGLARESFTLTVDVAAWAASQKAGT